MEYGEELDIVLEHYLRPMVVAYGRAVEEDLLNLYAGFERTAYFDVNDKWGQPEGAD